MSKQIVLLIALVITLWEGKAYAQEPDKRIISVDKLFQLADENSKSIHVSEMAVNQAAQSVKVAKTAKLPSIGASLSFSYLGNGWISDRDFSNSTTAPMPHFGNSFSVEASQVIYAGGAINAGIASAEFQQQIAELSLVDNRQNIRFMVLAYYLDLYKLNNQRIVYQKNIEQINILLKHIKARRIEGTALNNDITRYELQLQNLQLAVTELDNSCNIINYKLVSTLNLPQNTIIVPDSTLLSIQVDILSEHDWQLQAQKSLPHLQIADIEIALSRQQEKITNAEKLPQVALVAANNFNGPITIEVPAIDKNFNYWYLGVGLKYNISSLYTSNKKSKLNQYSTQQARLKKELAVEEAEIAVLSAYVRLHESFVQLHTQAKSVELAMQNYKVIKNRYLNDLALITDMIDASNSQLDAELQLVNLRINAIYSYYKLKRAAGVL